MPSVSVETTDWLMREIAGRGEGHDALAGTPKTCSLRKVETLSRPGIGAGVGHHDEAVAHQNPAAIRHGLTAPRPAGAIYTGPVRAAAMRRSTQLCIAVGAVAVAQLCTCRAA